VVPPVSIIIGDSRPMLDAARAGPGIAQAFDIVSNVYIESGELCRVMESMDIAGPSVHALIPLGRKMPLKTRVVLDFLAELMKASV